MSSESRNGMRHPQALNASVPSTSRVTMMTTRDTTMPSVGDVGDGAAVLAAQTQPLDEAKQQQDNPRRCADLGVARHEADESRRQTHAAQRDQERVLAAHDV